MLSELSGASPFMTHILALRQTYAQAGQMGEQVANRHVCLAGGELGPVRRDRRVEVQFPALRQQPRERRRRSLVTE